MPNSCIKPAQSRAQFFKYERPKSAAGLPRTTDSREFASRWKQQFQCASQLVFEKESSSALMRDVA